MKKLAFCALLLFIQCSPEQGGKVSGPATYDSLQSLFTEWREFQHPTMMEGVPDYSVAAMKKQHEELKTWQQRLNSFDTAGWPIKHQIDWYLVWAEMNGLDFDHRVVRPWEKDPAFYVWFYLSPSDVPEREGPNIYGAVDMQFFKKDLTSEQAAGIAIRLRQAGKVYAQAKVNLTGNGKDLWTLGARSIREQNDELRTFAAAQEATYPDMAQAAREAIAVGDEFANWVAEQAKTKTGVSGIGKADYDWCLKNVHLVPYTWQEEVVLLERELARAHQSMRLAEYSHRNLPPLERAPTAEAYAKSQHQATDEFMKFLGEEMMTVKPYMDPAMRAVIMSFSPLESPEAIRGFFHEVDYRDPMPMRAHFFHWIDKARELEEPVESPIRRVPLLYNIFDSRAEGMATAMEELVLNAGMLKNRPQVTELVHIMLAQRCARGLAGLYQHGQEMDFDQATKYASRWVPWGILPADGGTIQHEEHFYIQQPAYGESYVIGKMLIDQLIAEYTRQREGKFNLKEFMDEFNQVGIIPVSLVHWQMTGDKSMLNKAVQ
jgi:hypothetical protein